MIALDPHAMVSILAFTLLTTAVVLAMLPVGTCSQCVHCRLLALARERERERDDDRPL